MNKKYGIIILAAGASTRLGKPKQLLEFEGSTLLQHIIQEACSVPDCVTLVVTGYMSEIIKKGVEGTCSHFVDNNAWERGMSGSIKKGVEEMVKINPGVQACIVAVSDQPYVNKSVFLQLINLFEETGKGICACQYHQTVGTPAMFSKKYFPELLLLEGDHGAKKIISKYSGDLSTFPFEKGNIDIDTEADYLLLKK